MAMKWIKAWSAAILALAMVLGMAGCAGREPTAEELMAGVPEIDPERYYNVAVEMEVSAQADRQSPDISLSCGAEGCGDVLHLYDMDMALGVSGIRLAFSMEAWMEKSADSMYADMIMFGEDSGWMFLSLDPGSGALPVESFREMTANMKALGKNGSGLVLEPHEKGTDYVVTWTGSDAAVGDLSGMFSGLFGGFSAGGQLAGSGGLETGGATVRASFDEKTHDLKLLRIEAGAKSVDGEAGIGITIALHTVNGDQELRIPQNVIDTAVDVSGMLG